MATSKETKKIRGIVKTRNTRIEKEPVFYPTAGDIAEAIEISGIDAFTIDGILNFVRKLDLDNCRINLPCFAKSLSELFYCGAIVFHSANADSRGKEVIVLFSYRKH